MSKLTTVAAVLAGTLMSAGALAQATSSGNQQGGGVMQMAPMPGMPMPQTPGSLSPAPQATPMPGMQGQQAQGMCGAGGCGMCGLGASAQAAPTGGQGAMMGCSMMQRMTALDSRLRQLEQRSGSPTPPAQPDAPSVPH